VSVGAAPVGADEAVWQRDLPWLDAERGMGHGGPSPIHADGPGMRSIRLLGLAISLALVACAPTETQIREMLTKLDPVIRSIRDGPVLRDTADGCAVDLPFTNPFTQRMQVIVTYGAADADGRELAVLRGEAIIFGGATAVLHGDSSPGLSCATVARVEVRHLDLRDAK